MSAHLRIKRIDFFRIVIPGLNVELIQTYPLPKGFLGAEVEMTLEILGQRYFIATFQREIPVIAHDGRRNAENMGFTKEIKQHFSVFGSSQILMIRVSGQDILSASICTSTRHQLF